VGSLASWVIHSLMISKKSINKTTLRWNRRFSFICNHILNIFMHNLVDCTSQSKYHTLNAHVSILIAHVKGGLETLLIVSR
jgi:hypothetical protein